MNGYFNGVTSPITTQGEITINCRGDQGEVSQRKTNVSREASRLVSYPDDGGLDNQHVMPHELVFSWVGRRGRNSIAGHTSQAGFSSLNGVMYGTTDEELEGRLRFIGCAKTPFIFGSTAQLQSGFSAIGAGSGTTVNRGSEEFHPGEVGMWYVVPRPKQNGGPMPGGQFGDSGPGSRQGYPTQGTPRGKLLFGVKPCRFNDMRPSINAALDGVRKTMLQGGFSDRPLEHLFGDARVGGFQKPTPAEEHGMALFVSMAVTVCAGAAFLKDEGLIQFIGTELDLANKIGMFSVKPEERARYCKLIDTLFLDYSANRDTSRAAYDKLRTSIPTGFAPNSKRVVRADTLASRYIQVRTNIANYQELGFTRAYHSIARKRIFVALSHSKRGQQLDAMFNIGVA